MEDGAIKKVIVIGLDGLSPEIVSRLLEAGQLPNLARLKEQGGYSRVATTRPAQTPVAWSTFATGTNPGGHGIFDFLRRNPRNYLPDLALNRYEQKNAFLPPKAVNLRRRHADLGAPQGGGPRRDRPAMPLHVSARPDPRPDALGHGRPRPARRAGHSDVLHHRRDAAKPARARTSFEPQPAGEDAFSDPPDRPPQPQDGRRPPRRDHVCGSIARRGGSSLRSDGNPKELEVRQGAWSDWLRVKFKLGLLQSIRGMVRFYLVRLRAGAGALRLADQFRSRLAVFPDQRARSNTPATSPARSACSTRPAWSRTTPG